MTPTANTCLDMSLRTARASSAAQGGHPTAGAEKEVLGKVFQAELLQILMIVKLLFSSTYLLPRSLRR